MTNQRKPEEEERAHKHAKSGLRQKSSALILFPWPGDFGRTGS